MVRHKSLNNFYKKPLFNLRAFYLSKDIYTKRVTMSVGDAIKSRKTKDGTLLGCCRFR